MAAAISFEIEVALDGSVTPYSPATRHDPAEGGEVVGLTVADVRIIDVERAQPGRISFKATSLLSGVDRNAPEIRKLFANILAARAEDAADAVAGDEIGRAA